PLNSTQNVSLSVNVIDASNVFCGALTLECHRNRVTVGVKEPLEGEPCKEDPRARRHAETMGDLRRNGKGRSPRPRSNCLTCHRERQASVPTVQWIATDRSGPDYR